MSVMQTNYYIFKILFTCQGIPHWLYICFTDYISTRENLVETNTQERIYMLAERKEKALVNDREKDYIVNVVRKVHVCAEVGA